MLTSGARLYRVPTMTTTTTTTIFDESLNDFTTVRAPAVPCKCRRHALPYDGAFLNDSRNVRHAADACEAKR